jgi:hypothetical protein
MNRFNKHILLTYDKGHAKAVEPSRRRNVNVVIVIDARDPQQV